MKNVIHINFKKKEQDLSLKDGRLIEFKLTPELRRNRIYKLEAEIDRLEKIHGFDHPEVNKLWDEVENLWQGIFNNKPA